MMKELSMHIMDIVQNSVRAKADRVTVDITEDERSNILSFSITDNGCGMERAFVEKLTDPFTTSRNTRKVGLGIPLLVQTCEQCGGTLTIESAVGEGTCVTAVLAYDNIDRPPMGDIENSMYLMILMNPGIMLKFVYSVNGAVYTLDMDEVYGILGDVPIDSPEISSWLKENISEGLTEIRQGTGGIST